jgi:hypothetical protein
MLRSGLISKETETGARWLITSKPRAAGSRPPVQPVQYHAERVIAAFAARLQDATDLDAIRSGLAATVDQALEPARLSLWSGPRGRPRPAWPARRQPDARGPAHSADRTAGSRDHLPAHAERLLVSEAAGAGIEQPGPEHGHRTLTIICKGGKDDDDRLGPTPAKLRSCDTPARRYPAKTADPTGTAQQWLICARSRVKREQISAKPIRQGGCFLEVRIALGSGGL